VPGRRCHHLGKVIAFVEAGDLALGVAAVGTARSQAETRACLVRLLQATKSECECVELPVVLDHAEQASGVGIGNEVDACSA